MHKYKYLFGPVPSRRLGMSLGVDLVPRKVCSLDCVYCEVGKTTRLTLERREYVPFAAIVRELEDYFSAYPDPDFITFSGSGEPTLNSRIGEVIGFIKRIRPDVPLALLTNGTLLHERQVRDDIQHVDLVLPSLDAVTADVFAEINRPAAGLGVQEHIQGLIDFSRDFSGRIWLEVFVLPGINDHPDEIAAMRRVILEIGPDSVQLNTLDRPGTAADLRAATGAELLRVKQLLDLEQVEIIAAAALRKNIPSYRGDAEAAILETIARRPCTLDDLAQMLGLHGSEINKYLDVLDAENKIEAVPRERGVFYQLAARD